MSEKFALWHILFLQYLKRDWKKLMIWVLSVAIFSAGFVPSFKEMSKGNGLIGMFETLQNPAMISIIGPTPIETAKDYTLGAMYAHEMLLFCGLCSMIVSMLHVISHTRKEEELGLTELVRSFHVGRQANSLAAFIEILLVNVLISLLIFVIMMSFNVDTITMQGSLLFGISIGMTGIMGGSIALIMSQIMPSASSATGASLGIVGLLYILRAGTDVSNIDLSYANPLGWSYLGYPFTDNHWYPIIMATLFNMVVVIIAMILEGKRDMGASYIPELKGKAHAKKSLLSIHGLLFKINKTAIISWIIAFITMGIAYGSIYGDMQNFIEGNAMIKQMFANSNDSLESSFTSTIMIIMVSLVTILPIAIVNKLFSEESKFRFSQIFPTKVTRGRLYWTTIGLALLFIIIGILAVTLSLGGTALTVMDGHVELKLIDFLAAGCNYFPAILFFTGLATLALGWAPRLGKLTYAYLGYNFAINYFGGILDLPDWFSKTALFNWLPQMPKESFEIMPFTIMTLISIILIILGYVGYRNRDLIG
ncbi:tetronasin resistance protein [Staphylococcus gallinarum]|uniref:ABC transporter permease n=1 Tax=Staphylococcus gallinarum TaxID=1293 RepID=UPI000E69E4E3|nr:tetronasin resistance protein [Staphylococcus gallinarum]RIO84743.1 tetronasin resistance protein [Staphylococcus gallinarum]